MTVAAAALLALSPPALLWVLLRRGRWLAGAGAALAVGLALWSATHALAADHIQAVRDQLRDGPPHAWRDLDQAQRHALHEKIQGRLAVGRGLAGAADVAAIIAAALCLGLLLRAAYTRRLPGVGEDDVAAGLEAEPQADLTPRAGIDRDR